jgi:hypothetical protein
VFGQALINARSGGGGHKIGRAVEICAERGWIRVRRGSEVGLPAVTGMKSKWYWGSDGESHGLRREKSRRARRRCRVVHGVRRGYGVV